MQGTDEACAQFEQQSQAQMAPNRCLVLFFSSNKLIKVTYFTVNEFTEILICPLIIYWTSARSNHLLYGNFSSSFHHDISYLATIPNSSPKWQSVQILQRCSTNSISNSAQNHHWWNMWRIDWTRIALVTMIFCKAANCSIRVTNAFVIKCFSNITHQLK